MLMSFEDGLDFVPVRHKKAVQFIAFRRKSIQGHASRGPEWEERFVEEKENMFRADVIKLIYQPAKLFGANASRVALRI
jgi:hypothetical protein